MQRAEIGREIGELALRLGDAAAERRHGSEVQAFRQRSEIAAFLQRLLHLLAACSRILRTNARERQLLVDVAQLLIGNQLFARPNQTIPRLEFLDLPFGVEQLMP